MQLTKKEIIQKLYEIEDKENIKLGREVQRVIRNEVVPMDVIKLINKYDKTFLHIYDAYNTIYLSRNKNPLYRNLKNKNISIEELAVAISSLVTKILISCTKIKDVDQRIIFATAMSVNELNIALTNYSMFNKQDQLLECGRQVRELLEILYTD